jgi:hypothetical protein
MKVFQNKKKTQKLIRFALEKTIISHFLGSKNGIKKNDNKFANIPLSTNL